MHGSDPLRPIDERELVDRARTDPEAFALLYRQHLPSIHAFLYRRTGSVPLAEDLSAATFEKALRSLASFSSKRGAFGAWVHRIAANELIDHQRRSRREQSDAARSAMYQASDRRELGPGESPAADDDLSDLRAAMDELPERYRSVLSLRYFSDLDHDGAAEASGLAKPHFAVVLHRAKGALRRELDRRAVSS
ncbi:MAG TPA: RNA polymerase sigma factor [Acidimicrobiia bacterium]|nr:RNA polymerase sigma factor [Acidimicrobiia bacterium]